MLNKINKSCNNIKLVNKGFTLIEILAVIVLIGIVSLIGVVAISSYIESSRENTYINSASNYIDSARNLKASDKLLQEPKNAEALIIPLTDLDIEDDNEFKTPYGDLILEKSYVIITNKDGKLDYYISMIDDSGHALVNVNENKLSVDELKKSGDDTTGIKEINSIKGNLETIEIDGLAYQISNKNLDTATTLLLSYSLIDGFRIDVASEWQNHDKTVSIITAQGMTGYKFYLYDRAMKPLKGDSMWQSESTYVRGMGTYYGFIMSPTGEVSEGQKVVVDKIDKTRPTCSLKATGTKSEYGIYSSSAVISFENYTDGVAGPTTSGVKSHGIGNASGSTIVTNDINGEIEKTYVGYVEDNAGNVGTCEITIKSDGKKPVCKIEGPTNPYLKSGASTTYTVTCEEEQEFADSEITASDFTFGTSGIVTITGISKEEVTGGYKYTVTVKAVKQGATNITLKAGVVKDKADNVNDSVTGSIITVDTTAPSCTLKVTSGSKEGDYYYTNLTVGFNTATDGGGSNVNSYGIGGYSTKTATLTSDGTNTYTGYIKDNAGNESTCSITVKRKTVFAMSYNSNGGTTCTGKNVTYNQNYGALCTPTRTGYTFAGWYTEAALSNNVTASTKVTVPKDHTLYDCILPV